MNAIQTILVHVDAGPHGLPRLQVARALGARFGATVTALYAVTPVHVEMALELSMSGASKALLQVDHARLAAARSLVDGACTEPGVPIGWRESVDAPEYSFIREACYADLLVLGQYDREHRDTGVLPDFVQSVVIASARPALIVPYIGTRALTFGTVLVAWKETREAARALSAALPILRLAGAVHVALEADMQASHKTLLEQFLQRHGVHARYHTLEGAPGLSGEFMLSMAADLNADLLVMGCYGHSRAREMVLGGASRTALRSMTLPVLMAH
jgi:nucleotide-binding universal stress UspA family protein